MIYVLNYMIDVYYNNKEGLVWNEDDWGYKFKMLV